MTHRDRHEDETLQPTAGVLAFLLPGLGHIWLGEAKRGTYIMIGVVGLFLGGLIIGGIDVVDSREDRWWFIAEAGAGPIAFVADWWHQSVLKPSDPPANATPEWFMANEPARTKSFGHVNEIGSLYAAVAGMMNAIAIIDALWHAPRGHRGRVRIKERRATEATG